MTNDLICSNISINAESHLCFAGHDTTELARRYGTPLYLMDEQLIRKRCSTYLGAIRKYFGGDPYALCRAYFDTVCQSIQGTGADILGHIELVMKFNEARDLFDDADPRYLGPALECAELAARSGRLIEAD